MKNVIRPQYSRLKRILEMIREGTRTGRYPNAGDFCAEMEVSRPTVMRDLDWLRDEENAPIEYVPASHGYRLSDETWNLPPIQLSRMEVFAFSIAAKLLANFRGTPLEMDMRSVLAKVAESLDGTVTLDPQALSDRLTVIGEDYVVQNPATWTAAARPPD
jgi:proteasome accessory factor B